ncbi:xanthine dehydrogenase molybdopterin binding subunit [Haematobacter missouriensis]|uniref:Xanthine dehydrogenase molybdopterin binding subunit n=1 Tax=Haematobacter missouriensis TaxID=366616 RepID=A0A212ATD5_9RHOB|nr:xanthine dehydrogenase molybdopterin binding subunit [Haematobacter missouriensis]OWJ84761.1 xanthine dehydrogenase molybdopterin binding subunit [Haematobacter missouriensis]
MSVAKPLPHDAAPLHVSGKARYVDDIPVPANTLSLAFGLSTVARGRVTSLDLAPVRAAQGVVAVMGPEDLHPIPDVSPGAHDEPLIADGVVRYVGHPLFIVAATSHRAARQAARLARVTYAEEEPILSVEAALAASSRFEQGPVTWTKGEAEAAIAAAPRVVTGRIEMGGQEHFYLEGQAALVLPQEGGDMIVHSSTQHPTEIQHKVAEALDLPMNAVRVEVRRMGGGFGGKESQGNHLAVACALMARATGRPCKMRYDRDDDMTVTGKRHDFRIDYRVGIDGEGRILGIAFDQYTRAGWSQDLTLAVADRAMLHADNAYYLPAARITSHRLKTNMQSATAYRGFGGPQGMLGIERVLDHIAHAVGRDPLEVRKLNFYAPARPDAHPVIIGEPAPETPDPEIPEDRVTSGDHTVERVRVDPDGLQTTPYHMPVEDFVLHEMVAELEQMADYAARRDAIRAWNRTSPVLKRGIALTPVKFGISFTLTHLNQAGALVHVYSDGSIHLNHGGTEMGQGLFQKVAQVTAASFGVEADRVKITATDTGKVPNTSATAASSGSDLNGMAAKAAADTIRERMAAHLAESHQTTPEKVRFADGRVEVAGESYSFAEAAALCYQHRVSLSSTGFYATPKITWDRLRGVGRPFFYFAYGASVTEVVIDTLTGENRILRADILHDAGASLNPALDIGQVEGGYVQGAGWLTTEELVWDDKGRLRTHAPSTYKIPACSDRPRSFNVHLWEKGRNREDTIYRSKAVGEPPLMHGISALMALSDAIAACGDGSAYPDLHAPATPERILSAIARQRRQP